MSSLLSDGDYTVIFRRRRGQSPYYHQFVHSFESNISQKKKTTKWSICFYRKSDTAWDTNDACGQGWTLNKITFGSRKRHMCRMGCIGVGDGPVAGRPQQLPHKRGVTAATNLGSGCILDRRHVKLHSGAQQASLQVSKMLKNKEHEG